MAKWNDKTWTVTFDMQPDEKMKEFMTRMYAEHKELEESIKERIRQLFDEHIGVGGEKRDEAYNQILTLFSIGYQCGWNDHHSVFVEKKANHDS